MTSVLGKEDLRDQLYLAGVKNPAKLNKVMRLIETYAAAYTSRFSPDDDLPPDPWQHIRPGEWDMDLGISRCVKCRAPKRWALFPQDRKHVTKHGVTCKSCGGTPPPPPPDLKFTCKGPCGQEKPAGEFYRRPDTATGFGYKCKKCLNCGRKKQD